MSAFANLKWAYGKCIEEINKRPSADMTAPSGYIILDNGKKAQVQVTVTTNVDDFIPSPDDEKSFNNHLQKQILEQQPIPQDINKWIEDEAKKAFAERSMIFDKTDFTNDHREAFKLGAKLLLPELQQLKATIEFYRSEVDKVHQFINQNNDIGKPCQPFFDAIRDKFEQQKETIERLTRDNNGWISVKDKLPVLWGDYLVTSGNWVGSCHFDGEFYDYSVHKMKDSSRYILPVAYWMPLPQPPKTSDKNG